MNPIVLNALNWTKNRLVNFLVYALIGLAVWGVYWKVFVKETNNTTNTGQVQYYWQGAKQTTFGCATFPVAKEK